MRCCARGPPLTSLAYEISIPRVISDFSTWFQDFNRDFRFRTAISDFNRDFRFQTAISDFNRDFWFQTSISDFKPRFLISTSDFWISLAISDFCKQFSLSDNFDKITRIASFNPETSLTKPDDFAMSVTTALTTHKVVKDLASVRIASVH